MPGRVTTAVATALIVLAAAPGMAFAASLAPSGRYAGTAKPFRGTGGPRTVSFTITKQVMTRLVIGAGAASCHVPGKPGTGKFTTRMPRLSGFPGSGLLRFAAPGTYSIESTFTRTDASAEWTKAFAESPDNGPFSVRITGMYNRFINKGDKFVASLRGAPKEANLEISFGASAAAPGWNPMGSEECYVAARLTATHRP